MNESQTNSRWPTRPKKLEQSQAQKAAEICRTNRFQSFGCGRSNGPRFEGIAGMVEKTASARFG